jgi:hypothetical protein
VAAWIPDMFGNFYSLKSHKIANNSATTKAREKISADLDSEQFEKFFDIGLTKFETYQILFNKNSHRFPMTTKLYTGRKSLIQITILMFRTQGRNSY